MTEQTLAALVCPKCGAEMQRAGRRTAVARCTACRGIFMDVDAMRQGRSGRPPVAVFVLTSVVTSMLVSLLTRRLRKHPGARSAP